MIAEEVIPSITARYRVSDDRSYYGHSLGGLFGAYALFQSPQLFKRMILVSPALYWDDGVIFRSEETFAVRNKTLSAEVFLAAGDLEVAPMIPNVDRFSEALERRRYEGLKLHTRIFSDETHASIAGVAMTRGLRTLLREVAAK